MRLLLIGSTTSAKTAENYYASYIDMFEKAIGKAMVDATIDFVFIDDIFMSVGDGSIDMTHSLTGEAIETYDCIFIRGTGLRHRMDQLKLISVFAHQHGIKIINDYSGFRDSSKLGQAVKFHELGLPIAKTVALNRAVLSEKIKMPFTFPCIMKATFGAHGNDNYLVASMDEVRAISKTSSDKQFVLQRFVKNEGDLRILIVGDEVKIIGRTAIPGSHLNNTSQGGAALMVDDAAVPVGMIRDAKKVANDLAMTIAGVDVIIDSDTNEYYFLEVNSQPQLMSGAFLDEKVDAVANLLAQMAGE